MDLRVFLCKAPYSLFALRSPLVIGTGSEIMLDHGVADNQPNVVRNRYEFEFERAAVEQQSLLLVGHRGNELIHDANASANELVFRLATQLGKIGQGQSNFVERGEGESGSNFDGRGRTQPRADGNFSVNKQVCAGQIAAAL